MIQRQVFLNVDGRTYVKSPNVFGMRVKVIIFETYWTTLTCNLFVFVLAGPTPIVIEIGEIKFY